MPAPRSWRAASPNCARLGEALGAKRDTLMGLSGLGDLMLTATSDSSRNFSFGVELGRGKTAAALSSPGHPLAEGVATAPALVARARSVGAELPIAEAMADLISGALPLEQAVARLMRRKLKAREAPWPIGCSRPKPRLFPGTSRRRRAPRASPWSGVRN